MEKKFDKEEFRRSIIYTLKSQFRKKVADATPQEVYQAVAYAVKDIIVDDWIATHKEYEKEDSKTLYYLSMEFLMGRALGNNIINLMDYEPIKETLDEMGFDLNVIEDQEPDAALGNGGLGRLAACFLDSLATLGYPAYGCGIRYRYGMFKQKIENGYQVEVPDNATNRFTANGGVIAPIEKLITIISPKCTRSMPNALAAGARIGARIIMPGPGSKNIPTKNRKRLISSRNIYLFPAMLIKKLATIVGI